MRAAFYDTFGPPDVLTIGSIQEPELRAGDVLVQVVASGINPSDVKRRAGWRDAAWAGRRIVAHCDGAGIVVAAGDEAGRPWIGRRVWIWSIPGRTFVRDGLEYGTAAEYVPVPVSHLAVLPDGTDFATGACLGVPAITAHFTILADGPVAGQTVLVQAGGGAVGAIAVRIAREAGARVIATVRSAERAAIAREAGADVVVDLTDTEAERQVLGAAPGGVDRLIEVDFGANV
ncbi:MAG: zinc-binding dehydrogenase, partial [Microvirga sp.]